MAGSIVGCLSSTYQQFQGRFHTQDLTLDPNILVVQDPRRVYMVVWIDGAGVADIGCDTIGVQNYPWSVAGTDQYPTEFWIEKHKALIQRQFKFTMRNPGFIHVYEELYIG